MVHQLLFEEDADDTAGTKRLRLYSDTARNGEYILKIGSGQATKPVRLPREAPLTKAKATVGRELPGELVALLSSCPDADAGAATSDVRLSLPLTLTLPHTWATPSSGCSVLTSGC